MRKTAIITIILSLISLSSNVFAQDNIPEDFFKWFPKGQYESITHYSPILMKQEKAFKDYDETFNGISVRYHYGIPLPQAMMEACDGYTKGKLVKVKVEKLGETEEGFRPASPGGLSAQADIGGLFISFLGWVMIF